jgi:uncharacterized membrane protein SpoIIM required for sporulation
MLGHYSELIKYLREALVFIFFAVIVFLTGIFIGLTYPQHFGGLLNSFNRLAEKLLSHDVSGLIFSIFVQNSLSAFLAILLGELMGLVPILSAIMNGLLVGAAVSSIGENNSIVLIHLIPHGIFELPAIFLAWGLGIWRGVRPLYKRSAHSYKELRGIAFRIYLNIILPLLLIAAIIEGLGIAADPLF